MGDPTKGLIEKYKVTRTDGSSDPGGKHARCDHFVLDLVHDKFADAAIAAYAAACQQEYPALARDLRARLDRKRNVMTAQAALDKCVEARETWKATGNCELWPGFMQAAEDALREKVERDEAATIFDLKAKRSGEASDDVLESVTLNEQIHACLRTGLDDPRIGVRLAAAVETLRRTRVRSAEAATLITAWSRLETGHLAEPVQRWFNQVLNLLNSFRKEAT